MLLTHECLYRWAGRLTQRTIDTGRIFGNLNNRIAFQGRTRLQNPRQLSSLHHDIRNYPQESDRRFRRVPGAIGSLWRSQ
jgi:hypothetical protein